MKLPLKPMKPMKPMKTSKKYHIRLQIWKTTISLGVKLSFHLFTKNRPDSQKHPRTPRQVCASTAGEWVNRLAVAQLFEHGAEELIQGGAP